MTGDPNSTLPKTLSVPDAGRKYFGLSRNAAYAAARRGEIPTIRLGHLLKVPVIGLELILRNACEREPSGNSDVSTSQGLTHTSKIFKTKCGGDR
jgi:hypothetical protein